MATTFLTLTVPSAVIEDPAPSAATVRAPFGVPAGMTRSILTDPSAPVTALPSSVVPAVTATDSPARNPFAGDGDPPGRSYRLVRNGQRSALRASGYLGASVVGDTNERKLARIDDTVVLADDYLSERLRSHYDPSGVGDRDRVQRRGGGRSSCVAVGGDGHGFTDLAWCKGHLLRDDSDLRGGRGGAQHGHEHLGSARRRRGEHYRNLHLIRADAFLDVRGNRVDGHHRPRCRLTERGPVERQVRHVSGAVGGARDASGARKPHFTQVSDIEPRSIEVFEWQAHLLQHDLAQRRRVLRALRQTQQRSRVQSRRWHTECRSRPVDHGDDQVRPAAVGDRLVRGRPERESRVVRGVSLRRGHRHTDLA